MPSQLLFRGNLTRSNNAAEFLTVGALTGVRIFTEEVNVDTTCDDVLLNRIAPSRIGNPETSCEPIYQGFEKVYYYPFTYSAGAETQQWWYASAATSVTGDISLIGSRSTYSLELVAGWNPVVRTTTTTESGTTQHEYTNGTVTDGAWTAGTPYPDPSNHDYLAAGS